MEIKNTGTNELSNLLYNLFKRNSIENYINDSYIIKDFKDILEKLTFGILNGEDEIYGGIESYIQDYFCEEEEIYKENDKEIIQNSVCLYYQITLIPGEKANDIFHINNNSYSDDDECLITEIHNNYFNYYIIYDFDTRNGEMVEWKDLYILLLCQLKWYLFKSLFQQPDKYVVFNSTESQYFLSDDDFHTIEDFDVYEKYLKHIDMEGFVRDVY